MKALRRLLHGGEEAPAASAFKSPAFEPLPEHQLDPQTPLAGSGAGPFDNGRANPIQQTGEMQGQRDQLQQLMTARSQARSPEELQDLDWQISHIMRDQGMHPYGGQQ